MGGGASPADVASSRHERAVLGCGGRDTREGVMLVEFDGEKTDMARELSLPMREMARKR